MQMFIEKLQNDTATLSEAVRQHLEQANLETRCSSSEVLDAVSNASSACHVDLDIRAMASRVQAALQQCADSGSSQTDQLLLRLRVSGFPILNNFCNVSAAIARLQELQKYQSTGEEG